MNQDLEQFKPRLYQAQLEEVAVNKNTILHLPTGAGKTVIAAHLIKRFMYSLKKPWGEGGKRTFFLVNTVPLVNQQKTVIEKLCPVTIGGYSGEDKVDFWNKTKWDAELTKYEVIVMTSQILSDMLTHNYIKIVDINLMIFDECHQAVDDHPMRLIMKHFEECPPALQPRVLGLTAPLLNSNVPLHKVEETLQKLETTFHATIATVNDNIGEILRYSTNPTEMLVHFQNPTPNNAIVEAKKLLSHLLILISKVKLPPKIVTTVELNYGQQIITYDTKKINKEVANMVTSICYHLDELGAYGGVLCIIAYTILLERLKRRATSEEELMYTFTITHCTEAKMVLLNHMREDTGFTKIVKHSSPKVILLLKLLKDAWREKGNELSSIIFTQQRFTAKLLYNLLKAVKKHNSEFDFLKHDFIVGFNVNPYNNTREQHLTKKLSHQALLQFKNRDLMCLISTRVIEEGVDIPQCLLVIRYDLPLEYRSYIQSKGRARNKESKFIMMVSEENSLKFRQKYQNFQQLEGRLHQSLLSNCLERAAPTEEDIKALYEEDDIPPYVNSNGKRLFSSSAIALLYRYCSVLPHDQFTLITPMWILEKGSNQITIVMPIMCPVKQPIKGQPSKNLKTAKRSAALNACIKLIESGELGPEMLPRKYGEVQYEQIDIKECFPNWPWDKPDELQGKQGVPAAGTKKRVRKHKKVYPSLLNGRLWTGGNQKFYLHLIKLGTAFEKSKTSRESALYNLLQLDDGYGLLTMQPLPELCDFPMFLMIGEVTTSVVMNYSVLDLDLNMFELVKHFHFYVFDQVLAIAKKFVVFEGLVNCLYVVPTCKRDRFVINWDIMQTYKEVPPVAVPSNKERSSIQVTRETYQNQVVTPWYRATLLPDRYIVSDVLEHMTPNSPFDSNSFESYADYYSNKYQLEIVGPGNQPLLEVRRISTGMNCLLPRGPTIRAFTEKQKRLVSLANGDDKPNGFNEIFIPEFCIKYEYPSVLWYKAFMLPSIIHRVTMLLVAYELRAQIARDTMYGQPHLNKGEKWLPISTDLNKAMKSLLSQVEEPATFNSIDRINDPIDEYAPRPLNIVTMKQTIHQLQKKKLDKEYPWEETAEPLDVERNLTDVTLMDIECYDAFVMAPIEETKPAHPAKSPVSQPLSTAILPPPLRYSDKIHLLSRGATGRGPELRDILSALTTINSHDSFDLERVETLGDSFLKFASTLYLYNKFPRLDEGQLTNIKGRLLGNRNLYYAGEKINLGGRMKVEQFAPKSDFIIPGFFAPKEVINFIEEQKIRPSFLIGMEFPSKEAASGILSKKSLSLVRERCSEAVSMARPAEVEPEGEAQNAMQAYIRAQAVSDKSVADCVEALIGTYLLSGGIQGAALFLEWMKIFPPQDDFMSYLHKPQMTILQEKKVTEEEINRLLNHERDSIEKIIDYKFKDPSFLLEALSHSSYIRNRYTRSYERLEFLGDAIIDFLITAHIYENCGDLKPGELTDLRSSLVNNVTFASYVVKLGLHKFFCSDLNPTLDGAILNFVEHQVQRDHNIEEDVLYLIDEEDCRVAEYIEVPKVLSDIFESLAGAIYLDSGGNLSTVWRVVYRIMWREIAVFSQRVPKQPVRVLSENIYACAVFGEAKETPDSCIPKVMIPVTFSKDGKRHTTYGVGSNKSQAKRAAAKLALKILAL